VSLLFSLNARNFSLFLEWATFGYYFDFKEGGSLEGYNFMGLESVYKKNEISEKSADTNMYHKMSF
jgi:hypothetical protein